jgi:tetratricopeptide (TPR) repeat protein
LRKRILLPASLFLLSAGVCAIPAKAATPGPTDLVRQDLNQGRADEALQILAETLARNPKDAEAHNLRCRVYYQEEQWDRAITDCEAAVQLAPGDSNFHLWLGRAYGQKAAHASIVSGYQLARKVHVEFDLAVQLDPHNADALADLGEFDVMAPAVVGGGITHADAIVQQLGCLDPAAAFNLQARIAESKKDYASAEGDLKAAIGVSSYPADAWMDLVAFYRRRGRLDEMAAAAHTGTALDAHHGPALVDGASNLALSGREPQTAIQWLQQYLNSRSQSEIVPAFVVRAQLALLLQTQGDAQAAQEQFATVHALASAYRIPSVVSASARTGL